MLIILGLFTCFLSALYLTAPSIRFVLIQQLLTVSKVLHWEPVLSCGKRPRERKVGRKSRRKGQGYHGGK